MKKLILIVILVIVAVAGGLVFFLLRRPAPRAVDLLPDSTLVFLQVPDYTKAKAAFQQTSTYALWQEPEVRALLEQPLRMLDEAAGTTHITGNKTARELLLDALQGEVFVAVTHISPLGPPQGGLVFGTDTKTKLLQTKLALAHAANELKKQPGVELLEKKYLGVSYTLWRRDPAAPVCYTFLNSLLVCALSENTLRDIIARHAEPADNASAPLAGSTAYQNFVRAMPAETALLAYINPQPILALLGPLLAFQSQGVGLLNELAAIQATGLSVKFERGLCRETRLTQYRAGTHTPVAPVARQTIAFTTPQTILYNVRTANLAKTYDSITSALAQAGLGGAAQSISRFEQSLRQAGVRVVEDVLAKLGPEIAFVVNWREGAELPDVAFVTEIQDAPGTRPQLDKMFDSIKQQFFDTMPEVGVWDESEAGTRSLRTLRIGAGKIAPTYVTTEKFFILALTPDFARQLLHDSPATLATADSYQTAVKPLPATGSSFTYLDLRALYPHLHALPQNPLRLPKPATVTRHLAPYVSISVDTAEAETTYSEASLGTPVAFIAGVVAGYLGNQSAFTLPLGSPIPSSSTASPR